MENIDTLKIKLNNDNNKLAVLQNSFDNKENISEEKLNAAFVGMKLAEIEYAIGLPKRYGSFDYGLDSGFWSINKINVEIWFQNLICTSVELI